MQSAQPRGPQVISSARRSVDAGGPAAEEDDAALGARPGAPADLPDLRQRQQQRRTQNRELLRNRTFTAGSSIPR